MKTNTRSLLFYAKPVIGTLLFLASLFFIWLNRKFYALTPEALGKYLDVKWFIIGHIAGGGIALLAGPFLLWAKIRNRYLKTHRFLGKIYIVSILVAGISALYLCATTAREVGWAYVFSLCVLATLWITSAMLAYYYVRLKKIRVHEEWTKRSYIITVAFIAQNFLMYQPTIASLGSFAETSPTIIWMSWSVPLFVFEIYQSVKRTSKR